MSGVAPTAKYYFRLSGHLGQSTSHAKRNFSTTRSDFLSHRGRRRTRAEVSPASSFPSCFYSQSVTSRELSALLTPRNSERSPSIATSNNDNDAPDGGADGPSRNQDSRQEKALERFTHFALNPKMVPLGAMQEENWLDVSDAIDGWLGKGGGFGVDSAELLLERLLSEHAASYSGGKYFHSPSYLEKSTSLARLQREVLNSWIQAFHLSGGSSQLALSRAERAMFRLLKLKERADKKTLHVPFPVEQYIAIVDGYLEADVHRQRRPTKAGNLLRTLISYDNFAKDLKDADHFIEIGPLLENCTSQLLGSDPRNLLGTELVEKMKVLKKSGTLPDIKIPDVTKRIQVKSSFQRTQDTVTSTTKEMSPFEIEVTENRLLEILNSANEVEKDTVDDLLQRLPTLKPRIELIVAILEYYIRIKDSEASSYWLQELEPSFLVTSYDLVERVLKLWLTEEGSGAPWRADEVFKAVARKIHLYDDKFLMSSMSLKLIVENWASSEDPSASRKMIDWYSQLTSRQVKPDESTLVMILQALRSTNTDKPLELVSGEIFQQWKSFSSEQKERIATEILELIALKRDNADMILEFVDRLLADNVVPSEVLFRSSISAIQNHKNSPSDVLSVVYSFDEASNHTNLTLYTSAIDFLFKMNEDAMPQIEALYDHVLKEMAASSEFIKREDFSEFLYVVIAMHVNRKLYSQAENFLTKAETLLLPSTAAIVNQSPIPLKCYKKIIVRKWYTAKTAPKVEESFENLMKLYHSGYRNLQPDSDLYHAYISARVAAGKDAENNLHEMIEQYELVGKEEMKPQASVFNTVLLSLSQGKGKPSMLEKKSITLLERMSSLGVQPDIKTINLVLKNVIKGKYDSAYNTSTMLTNMIEEHGLRPDSHTLHLVLDACGSAPAGERNNAIRKCLSTFGDIRTQNFVGPITYGILSKVVYRLVSRDLRADKIGESIFSLCCEDGMLTSEVRGRLKSMMSRTAWEKKYTRHLSSDKSEPPDWSRNIGIQ